MRLARLADEEEARLRRDEEERRRRQRLAEEEAEKLLGDLQDLEDEEAEKKRRLAAQDNMKESTPDMDVGEQICAFGDMDLMGLTEQELDSQCDELFRKAPVKFVIHDQTCELSIAISILI